MSRQDRGTQGTPSRRRRGTVLRVVGAASTGMVAVGAVVAATVLAGPWAGATVGDGAQGAAGASAGVDVAVDPAPATLVCPPPARLPDGLDVGDSQFDATPVETDSSARLAVAGAAGDATWGPLGGEAQPLGAGSVAAVGGGGISGGTVLVAQPDTADPLRPAGAIASRTTAGDLRGLAAASCAQPAISQWLVGGGTEVGSTDVLTVTNTSTRSATVSLDVYGPTGQVALGSRGVFLVGPGQSVETAIEAVAPDQRRVAVHVRSTGARVTASLQVQALAGLLPRGVDIVEPGAEPATTVTVAGVVSDGQAPDDETGPVLRVLAPGGEAGTARVSVFGADGAQVLRGAQSVELAPGVVTDVPLGGLPAGGYAVVVDADVPVVAGAAYARSTATTDDALVQGTLVDVAWVPGRALPEPGGASQVAVPGGARVVVSLAAIPSDRGAESSDDDDADGSGADADGTTATLRVLGADGEVLAERELTLASGALRRVDLADLVDGQAPAAVLVEGGPDLPVVWGLELSTADAGGAEQGLVSSLAPTAAFEAAGTVPVRAVDVLG